MSEDKDTKWDCSSCTYRNYIASRKCVMCNQVRPTQVISDIENSEQDIYKVAELEARNNETSNIESSKPRSTGWTCDHCSYQNRVEYKQCVNCRQRKQVKDSGESERSLTGPDSRPTDTVERTCTSTSVSTSPDPVTSMKTSDSICGLLAIAKWSCQLCTYDNQPKNKKCAMCQFPRDKKGFENITTDQEAIKSSALQLEIDVNIKNQENKRSGQNSPNKPNDISEQNNANKIVTADNKRHSPGSNQHSGQGSPQTNSGNNSPNTQRVSSPLPGCNMNLIKTCIIPYGTSDVGQKSPKQTSPTNNRSGTNSPGQSSPTNNKRGSPLVARSSNSNRNQNRSRIEDGAGAIGGYKEDERKERRLQRLRKKLTNEDIVWLKACEAIIDGDFSSIEGYLASGGDPTRQLTKDEVLILDRPSSFEVGHTLVHLALRFRRDDMVASLLAATDITTKGFKRLPSYICPDLSSAIRRDICVMLRQKKGTFPCYFLMEFSTFTLPADIEDLPRHLQSQLFEEILDTDVEKELTEECVINWSVELTEKHGSRLYALWNRTAGDCLLDSVLQATWGILDVDNTLRKALADSLTEGAYSFFPKWKEYESRQADLLNFTLEDYQWQKDWALLLTLAGQPGASLEQLHIFALAHILRRPIIVYGVKVVKSFRGESIDFARFEGVYLPLLWERAFCSKVPIALGYTRGHFSALVSMEIDTDVPLGAGADIDNTVDEQIFYLPLVDHEGAFLPIHFISGAEMSQEEMIFRRWFECYVTQEGHFVAIQKIGKRLPVVNQMLEMWLDHYRQLVNRETQLTQQAYSSDADSDQE